jgi:U6 snRNA-associated Sm-like protein LSm8
MVNIVLSEAVERIFAPDAGSQTVELPGLHIVRGDNVALIGQVDPVKDAGITWDAVSTLPLQPIKH